MSTEYNYWVTGWTLFTINLVVLLVYFIWIIISCKNQTQPSRKFIVITFSTSLLTIKLGVLLIMLGKKSRYLIEHKMYEQTFVILQFLIYLSIWFVGINVDDQICGNLKDMISVFMVS